MSTSTTNISVAQFVLSCVGTVITILVMVVGAYISLRVDGERRETRINMLEKRVDRTDEKFDKIMEKLTELEVKISKKD
jgi:uncharacterized membrane protein YhiD involved in acid resistance